MRHISSAVSEALRGLREAVADRLTTPVLPSDRRAWALARTVADLGEATARWLDGSLWSQPNYQPNCGPDEETRHLIPTLAAANRAGYLTADSQPGLDEPGRGVDGGHLRQRAAVHGFITDRWAAAALCDAAKDAGLRTVCNGSAGRHTSHTRVVAVTTVDGEVFTGFGAWLSRQTIRETYEDLCSDEAVDALQSACQITLIDPEWGRDDRLWPMLRQFAGTATARASRDMPEGKTRNHAQQDGSTN